MEQKRVTFENDCSDDTGCSEYQCYDTDTDSCAWMYDMTEEQIEVTLAVINADLEYLSKEK